MRRILQVFFFLHIRNSITAVCHYIYIFTKGGVKLYRPKQAWGNDNVMHRLPKPSSMLALQDISLQYYALYLCILLNF